MRSRRERATLGAVLCTVAGCCAAAQAARAQTGGMPVIEPVKPTTGGTGYGDPGMRAVRVQPTALRGQAVFVRGTFPGRARRRVVLQRFDAAKGWRNERRGRVRSTERFRIRWRAHTSGRHLLRVALAPRRGRSARAAGAPVAHITVYRRALATYYGPGFYGRTTACGQVLTPTLLGVAHKTLPCGTPVALLHRRREVVVPVVDRGPYNGSFSLDLTQATADALAFSGSGPIGFIRLRS